MPHPLLRVIGCHSNSATVNHFGGEKQKKGTVSRKLERSVNVSFQHDQHGTLTLVGLAVILEL